MTSWKKNFKYYFLILLAAGTFFIWYAVFIESKSILTVAFLDVGQGDAIFIEAPGGNQVLVDGGKNSSVLSELSKVMPFYDRTIDLIIATHPDADHIGGLPEVLNNYEVKAVMESGNLSESAFYKELEKMTKKEKAVRLSAQKGQRISLGGGVYLDILFPVGDAGKMESNASSIVVKLVYGGNSFLFTGDSPRAVENYLASVYKDNLDVDVLKVGHHGSDTSSSEMFTGYASPAYAIISAGKDNSYGHPHKETIDTLNKFGAKILATYELGTIIFRSDGEKIKIKK
ncbi:TPA: MBL fold metallo-hydrolase [Patescibacteria group bacterium]|nr:MAG: ComEC/Rec2 family protein [Parcubacteria group bacterium GW2011_GWF2_40_10]KKR47457.1 MAG: ComEC/Rec2 family protein [Parcubacteria group bacterium GW2011_GWA2_40_143]KKR59878.1 MAG: ComEC/Rec2 family protein [Parcubacteria group bacterium GW2011_GWC2_40_31]KKR76118.1 MAG: ComEC/Rec2 family protein [Parcubacteria group bacterium GW2011_GWE2_40_8]KKR80956.1 MAG: ComEC/Rec2 family protein [Parcubacteria group bacterium GW2011_GWD2_40_9]HBB56593.1 MBL fold metallo-hydrolase [Patescibacter